VDIRAVAGLGFPTTSQEEIQKEWFDEYETIKNSVMNYLDSSERKWVSRMYEDFLADALNVHINIVLEHGDFCKENVLLPSSWDRLQVIDFEDVGIGSSFADFCEWLAWLGKKFIYKILESYTFCVDDYFVKAIEFYYIRIPLTYIISSIREKNLKLLHFGKACLDEVIVESKTW
jgi:hypothetical protein